MDSGSFLSFNKSYSFIPDEFATGNITIFIKTEETFSFELESAFHGESFDDIFMNFDSG